MGYSNEIDLQKDCFISAVTLKQFSLKKLFGPETGRLPNEENQKYADKTRAQISAIRERYKLQFGDELIPLPSPEESSEFGNFQQ